MTEQPTLPHLLLQRPLTGLSSGVSSRTLSPDADLVVRRIRLVALAVFGLYTAESVVGITIFALVPEFFSEGRTGIAGSFWLVVASALAFPLLGVQRIPVRVRFGIGLTYVVLIACVLSAGDVASQWWSAGNRFGGLPWVTLWIVLIAVTIPLPFRTIVILSLGMSATAPLALFAGVQLFDLDPAPAVAYLDIFVPSLLAGVVALVPARVVHGLRKQVRDARQLGSYRLEERLGSGGMGEVWRARHRMLVRPAAIKLIRPEKLAGAGDGGYESLIRRFELEAQATASLRSPHTVELYDFGVSEDGTLFYVMELLDGIDLEEMVARFGPLPAARVVLLLQQLCDSLADAHMNGLLHRDIKPANVYACRLGQRFDFVKVLDFGLVKLTQTGSENLALTGEQMVLGSPAFLAPEMATGTAPVDHRLDLYGVGCVGYWLLTGGYVFEADSPLAMVTAHVQQEPVPPSQRSELDIPEELDRIILDCLAKDPAARPQSAGGLADRLAQCECAGEWSARSARAWWGMHLSLPTA